MYDWRWLQGKSVVKTRVFFFSWKTETQSRMRGVGVTKKTSLPRQRIVVDISLDKACACPIFSVRSMWVV